MSYVPFIKFDLQNIGKSLYSSLEYLKSWRFDTEWLNDATALSMCQSCSVGLHFVSINSFNQAVSLLIDIYVANRWY